MQARRDNDLKDSFYLYIMRRSIGAGLRNRYTPNGHIPDQLAKLLDDLNHVVDRPLKRASPPSTDRCGKN
jgi:hypothetical protein